MSSSARIKSAVFVMLEHLARAVSGQLSGYFAVIIPAVCAGMEEKNSAIKVISG